MSTLKQSALVETSKNTITPHTSKLKSISKYQLLTCHLKTFEKYNFLILYFEAGETRTYVVPFAIAELGHKCVEPAATLNYEP